jgi:hypothetical protein
MPSTGCENRWFTRYSNVFLLGIVLTKQRL